MPKTKWIFLAVIVIISLVVYKFWYLDYKVAAYEDIPDLSQWSIMWMKNWYRQGKN